MKKMLLSTIAAMIVLTSCEKPSLTDMQTKYKFEKISTDKLFGEMLLGYYNTYSNIQDIELLTEYLNDQDISKTEEKNMHLIFGFSDKNVYLEYLEDQNKRLLEIDKRYNIKNIPSDELKREIINTYVRLGLFESQESTVMALSTCESIRRNCILEKTAEATVMQIGCALLDISILAGAVCHGAAFVYQWTAGNNCNLKAKKCIEKERKLATNKNISR